MQQQNKDSGSTSNPPSSLATASTATSKPTASVQPVKQERPETPVSIPSGSPVSPMDTKPVNIASSSKDSEKSNIINGSLGASSTQDLVSHSATTASVTCKPNGPVSLLQPSGSACTSNGDMDTLKSPDLIKSCSGHKVVSTGPGQSVVKLTVPCTSGATGTAQSRNIVISTVNKTTGAVGSKVVAATPTQGGKMVVNTPSGKSLQSSSSTSILSPRVASAGKVSATTGGKVTVVSGTQNSTGSKVITVTTPGQGRHYHDTRLDLYLRFSLIKKVEKIYI